MGRVEIKGQYKVYGWLVDEALKLELNYEFENIKARSMKKAKAQACIMLSDKGWGFVNDDALVMEVERVYETRWDCMAVAA